MSRESNQMAYVAEITHLIPIKDADMICKAVINCGWPVVVKKEEFKVGDLVIMCEIDSWIPTTIADFLSKGKEPKIYNGVQGERLKAVRLKKTPSQGLVLPLSILDKFGVTEREKGSHVGEALGIQKWEAPEGFSAGNARGSFPNFWKKSDQERIQNLHHEVFGNSEAMTSQWEITTKMDGSSMSVGLVDGDFTVASRNINLKIDSDDSTFVTVAKKVFGDSGELLKNYDNLQFIGELCGGKIQANFEQLDDYEYRIFDIFDINKGEFLSPNDRHTIVRDLNIKHVPVLTIDTLNNLGLVDIDKMLVFAEGPSMNGKGFREGIVFKRMDGQFSFKCVSNQYVEDKST